MKVRDKTKKSIEHKGYEAFAGAGGKECPCFLFRRLIENQPEINLAHIDKLLRHFNGEVDDINREYVIDWLQEAGEGKGGSPKGDSK